MLVPDQAVIACKTLPVQVLPCSDGDCPVDCRLSAWTTWSVCAPATQERDLFRILPREREDSDTEDQTEANSKDQEDQEDQDERPKRHYGYGAATTGYGYGAVSHDDHSHGYGHTHDHSHGHGHGYGHAHDSTHVVAVANVTALMCVQNRTRSVAREPSTGGRQCSGQGYEERFCSDSSCQGRGHA